QHAAAFRLQRLQVLQALDLRLAPDRAQRPPPRARELEQAHAQRVEAFAGQAPAPLRRLPGEAQRDVDLGRAPAFACQMPGQPAHAAADRALPQPWQVGGGGHHPQAQPHRPVAWSEGGAGRGRVCSAHAGDSKPSRTAGRRRLGYPAPMPKPFPRKEPGERMLRWLYSLALYLLSPFTLYHLVSRGFRVREYFRRWDERYAAYGTEPGRPCVWLHAVSVGEVNAAAPLVNALLRQGKATRWVITTITPTGSQRVLALWGGRVEHVYLPYDLPGSVDRFLLHFRPTVALIMETELWPNMLFGCRDHGIPVYVVNARLSARSLRGYRLLRALLGRALRTVRCVAAQSAADARRFQVLGALPEQVRVLGNLKYDVEVPDGLEALRAGFGDALGRTRPVWIAAST